MKRDSAEEALDKLAWIANLSKKTCPEGVPGDEEATRELLNRIVLEVREACRLLEGVMSDESDLSDRSDESDRKQPLDPYGIAESSPEVAANTLLCLSHQAIYLLKRQIERLEKDFIDEGGFTERLYRARIQARENRRPR